VRTYAPTLAQSERISQWFASLKNSGAEMFVSLDQTKPENDGAAAAFLDRLVDAGFQVDSESVHRCKEEDMLRNYPALAKHNRIMWNYHTQGIDLWLQAHLANKKNHEPAYIWILEDDLGYTGDMADFMAAYAEDTSDLIAGFEGSYDKVMPTRWHCDEQTDLYKKRVPSGRMRVLTHVQRMSAKLLRRIHKWSVEGAMDVAESMPSTMCKVEKMSSRPFRSEDKGSVYGAYGRVSQQAWNEFVQVDRVKKQGRLYHALKF